MKYAIRRKDRAISPEEAFALLDAAEYGVLSLVDADGSPYGVPLNHARVGNTLILHGSTTGRKMDCIRRESRVSYCAVGKTEPVREKFTTRYESVIVSGRAELVEEPEQKMKWLLRLCERFAPEEKPNHLDAAKAFADRFMNETAVILVAMESITGKANP